MCEPQTEIMDQMQVVPWICEGLPLNWAYNNVRSRYKFPHSLKRLWKYMIRASLARGSCQLSIYGKWLVTEGGRLGRGGARLRTPVVRPTATPRPRFCQDMFDVVACLTYRLGHNGEQIKFHTAQARTMMQRLCPNSFLLTPMMDASLTKRNWQSLCSSWMHESILTGIGPTTTWKSVNRLTVTVLTTIIQLLWLFTIVSNFDLTVTRFYVADFYHAFWQLYAHCTACAKSKSVCLTLWY